MKPTTLFEKEALNKLSDFYKHSPEMDSFYSKMDFWQKKYWEAFDDKSIVFVDAPAGTGKTQVAVHKGLTMLRNKQVDKIIYVRFPSKRGQSLGALPGSLEEKEAAYMLPFYECLEEMGLDKMTIEAMEKVGVVQTSTDLFLRGRTLKDAFLIIDESQNSTELEDLKLVLTRINDRRGSTALIGHSGQTDSKVKLYTRHKLNAFQVYGYHMCRKNYATKAHLENNYRSPLAQWADKVEESLVKLELEEI